MPSPKYQYTEIPSSDVVTEQPEQPPPPSYEAMEVASNGQAINHTQVIDGHATQDRGNDTTVGKCIDIIDRVCKKVDKCTDTSTTKCLIPKAMGKICLAGFCIGAEASLAVGHVCCGMEERNVDGGSENMLVPGRGTYCGCYQNCPVHECFLRCLCCQSFKCQ